MGATFQHYMKHLRLRLFLLVCIVIASCGGDRNGFYLRENGECPYAIVVSDESSLSEKHAAQELQAFLNMLMGAELPIINESDQRASEPPRIFVGAGKLAAQLLSPKEPIDLKKFEDEGFTIRTISNKDSKPDVVIAGAPLRGTMYGVYTFLNRLGFRWYTNRKTWLPANADAWVPHMDGDDTPAFIYREPYISEAFDGDWAARNRINSWSADFREEHGGKMGVLGVHTFSRLIPYSLFNEHPDYFPMIGGKRVTGYVQRCLSNPGVVEVAAKNMIKWMSEEPDAKIFCLSQEDTEKLCECPDCVKMTQEEGSPAGLYLHFVNQVAEIVEKTYPDKFVSTLAYWFTEKPPKTVKPRKNVIIRLAPIGICVAHPFTECTDSASVKFNGYLKGWSQIASSIFIWHYNTDFNYLLMPFPNFKEFMPDTKNYHENGVRGIFFQGSAHGPGGGDADLRAWVMARLLWNPYQDGDALVNEWLHAVYGKAFKPMRAYYDLIHTRVADPNRHMRCFEPLTRELWPDDVVKQMHSLHEEALSLAAGDTTALYYIKKNHMAVKFVDFILNTGHLEVADGQYKPAGNKMTLDDYNNFMEYTKQFGVHAFRENSGDATLIKALRQRVETHPVVSIENNEIRLDVAPELGGRIVQIIYKKTGKNIINQLDISEGYYPTGGGYDESTTRTWGCTGFSNPYEATIKGKTITLEAKVASGLRFIRTITLPEKGAKIKVSSSIFNENKAPHSYQLVCRMHLIADPQNINIKARSGDGSFIIPKPSEERIRGTDVRLRYDGPNKPAGAWRVGNIIQSLTIENRFDNKEIETCMLNTSTKRNLVLMEIHSPVREVPAKGRITVNHEWEVVE